MLLYSREAGTRAPFDYLMELEAEDTVTGVMELGRMY